MAEEEAGTHLQPRAPRISDSQPPQPREPLQMGLSLSEPGPKATSTAPAWSRWANGGRVHRTRVPSPSGHPRETQPQPAMETGSQDSGPANKTPATPTPCPRPPRDTKRGKRVPLLHLRRFGKTRGLQAGPPITSPGLQGFMAGRRPRSPTCEVGRSCSAACSRRERGGPRQWPKHVDPGWAGGLWASPSPCFRAAPSGGHPPRDLAQVPRSPPAWSALPWPHWVTPAGLAAVGHTVDAPVGGWVHGWTDGHVGGWTDGWVGGWVHSLCAKFDGL